MGPNTLCLQMNPKSNVSFDNDDIECSVKSLKSFIPCVIKEEDEINDDQIMTQ